MNNIEFLLFSSNSYMSKTNVCIDSIKKYHPNSNIHLIKVNDSNNTYVDGLAKQRIEKLLELVKLTNNNIILLGSDCVLYNDINDLSNIMNYSNIIITPHLLNPPKQHGDVLYKTGIINADILVVNKNSIPILEWLVKQDMIYSKERGLFYEQTWLTHLPFIFSKVYILKHPGYNFAYFNFHERELVIKDNSYMIRFNGNNYPLKIVQYSGYETGYPEKISKYYRANEITPTILNLFKDYDSRIKIYDQKN